MSKAKFKVGDTVRILCGTGIEGYTGGFNDVMLALCGEIRKIREVTARGENSEKPCYYLENTNFLWDERGLERVDKDRKIVITTDGKTTRAALYDSHKLIKEAKTICSKDDTFDFEAGAKIAFERLTAKPAEPKKALKKLNTKIFIIDGHSDFKSGHIYEIKDGKIRLDNGWKYPVCGSLYSMDDVHKYFNGKSDTKCNSIGESLGGFSTKKQVKVMEVKED